MLDDFTHFIKYHQTKLSEIAKYSKNYYKIPECNIDECQYSSRHYRVNNDNDHKQSAVDIDPNLRFYGDIIDSFHFYIFLL